MSRVNLDMLETELEKWRGEIPLPCAVVASLIDELRPTRAPTRWVQGMGCGLPHGAVCVVLSDGEPFLREWHPVGPNDGNWWPLAGERGEMIREHEVTAYVVTGLPEGYEVVAGD